MTDFQFAEDDQRRYGEEQGNVLTVDGYPDPSQRLTEFRMSNGQVFQIPTELLYRHEQQQDTRPFGSVAPEGSVIPILEERLEIGKRVVTTGTVRIKKTVEEYQEQLNEPLAVRTFDIERVTLNQRVESAPSVRQEGDTTIYPIVEEQLVLTKQLVLKEELRVTKRDAERLDTQIITLRRENVTVERESIADERSRVRKI